MALCPYTAPENDMFAAYPDHPTDLFESAAIHAISKPKITWTLNNNYASTLSKPQAESVARFFQATNEKQHDFRLGFWMGHATGTGKGHVIAASFVEAITLNFSQDNGEIGRHLNIIPNEDLKTPFDNVFGRLKKETAASSARTFTIKELLFKKKEDGVDVTDFHSIDGVLVATYHGIASHGKTIQKWLSSAPNADQLVIVCDEAHHLKNPETKSTIAFRNMMEELPDARVMFSTATIGCGVSEIQDMGVRLGLWTNDNFKSVLKSLLNRSSFPYIASLLTKSGNYTSYLLDKSVIMKKKHSTVTMTAEQENLYNKCASLFSDMIEFLTPLIASGNKEKKIALSGRLYGASLSLFRELILLFKKDAIVAKAKESIQEGNAVIIVLTSTGESYTDEKTHGIENVVYKLIEYMKHHIPEKITELDAFAETWKDVGLPTVPVLDLIVEELGRNEVADMTGRLRVPVKTSDGCVYYVSRSRKMIDLLREAFQKGKFKVCVTSQVMGEGVGLHAEHEDSLPRHMILGQQGWIGPNTLQFQGRPARTGQTSVPIIETLCLDKISESTFSGRLANTSRSFRLLTQGSDSLDVLGAQKDDCVTTGGVKAIDSFIADLNGMSSTPDELISNLGLDMRSYLTYQNDARIQLKKCNALANFGGTKRSHNYDDDELFISNDSDKKSATKVKQFTNRILNCPTSMQVLIQKHIDFHMERINQNSAHAKPFSASLTEYATHVINNEKTDGNEIRLTILESRYEFHPLWQCEGTTFYKYSDDGHAIYCFFKVGSLLWRISPRSCTVATSVPSSMVEITEEEEAKQKWDSANPFKIYIVEDIKPFMISGVKFGSKNSTMPLRQFTMKDGKIKFAFQTTADGFTSLFDHYED